VTVGSPVCSPHANSDESASERIASRCCGRQSVGRLRKRYEERVALGGDLDATVTCEFPAQRGSVFGQLMRIPVVEFLEEAR
jgi:hypothetical protein